MGYDCDVVNFNNSENNDGPSPTGEPALDQIEVPDWYDVNNPMCKRGFDLGGILCSKCKNACHRGCLSVLSRDDESKFICMSCRVV